MQFSLKWLQSFFENKLSVTELEKSLTQAGLEVDSVFSITPLFENVIVAKVKQVQKHPNADKLCIATVFDGQKEIQVVCGAANCRANLITAFAPIGAILVDAKGEKHTIKESSLRGVASYGMLLSAEELGLNHQSDGIVEFSEEFTIGDNLKSYFQDDALEISFTPNLGHAMSHLGVVREISAHLNIPYQLGKLPAFKSKTFTDKSPLKVKIESEMDCPSYACLKIKDVQVGPSPFWLKQKLEACKIKSINNVVDATNYILHEIGQPLHAFDLDKIQGHSIHIKRAHSDVASWTSLDKVERNIPKNALLVCDEQKPIALAGLMGGANTEITSSTKNILLEAAHFNSKAVRKMSKMLGLYTEASKHFERGIDQEAVIIALERAAKLIQLIAGGECADKAVLAGNFTFKPRHLLLRTEFLNKILGTSFNDKKISSFLKRLEFTAEEKKEGVLKVLIPSYRNDIQQEVDLIDEVARIYQLDNLTHHQTHYTTSSANDSPQYILENKLHQSLLNEGLQEVISCDLIHPTMNQIQGKESESITIVNYMSVEQSVLRTSLLANHLQIIKHNQDHQMANLALYEIGKVYKKKGELFDEMSHMAITLTGNHSFHDWQTKTRAFDFFDLKGMIENISSTLHVPHLNFKKSSLASLHPHIQAEIFSENHSLGHLGQVHPTLIRKWDLKQPVFFAEISLLALLPFLFSKNEILPLPLYPSSERDWTITCLKDLEIGHLMDLIRQMDSRLLKEVFLLDLYCSDKLGEGRKNVTLRFVYRNDKKTIAFEAVEVEHARITGEVRSKLKHLIIQPT